MIIGTVHSKSVGKTTLAVHLAGWLDLYEYDVAIVDADWQEQCSTWLAETAPRIHRHVISDPDEIAATVPKLHEQHEIVIVDGPAGLHETPGAVLSVADAIIVPCGPTAPEIDALSKVATTIRAVQQIRSQGGDKPWPIVVPVKTHPRHITTRVLLEETVKLGFVSTKTTIPCRESYARLFGLPGKPRHLMWQLGRSKDIKAAVGDLDSLFQEMFPEAAEKDPKLMARIMSKPIPRSKKLNVQTTEEHEERKLVGNG